MNFELLKLVVEQIEKDASYGDYTAIEELLTDIPTEKLKGFLSEDEEGIRWVEKRQLKFMKKIVKL